MDVFVDLDELVQMSLKLFGQYIVFSTYTEVNSIVKDSEHLRSQLVGLRDILFGSAR